LYHSDCLQLAQIPGAGMAKIEPFKATLKDGFFEVDCVKDYLHEHGDKHGGNKFSYELSTNVSIVHYSDHVAKEDQQQMSRKVCFDFCRTIPDMPFFGLANGRDCYCAPYYKAMAGDSSMCDSVCPGQPTTMCGGKSKSSIFSMHLCADTATDLKSAGAKAEELSKAISGEVDMATGVFEGMQAAAEDLQNVFGQAGDPTASDLMQSAKVSAGELQAAAKAATEAQKKLDTLAGEVSALEGGDFKDAKHVKKAEKLIDDLEEATEYAETTLEAGKELFSQVSPGFEEAPGAVGAPAASGGSSAQYYPLMYFVDKEFDSVPSTCGGDAIGEPMVAETADVCASACDADVHNCAGYSYYEGAKVNLCFLFSKFKTATYYTECKACGGAGDETAFLQKMQKKKAAACSAGCYAKLLNFEGTTLKPDPSGKCKQCLKSATQAARCFQ